MIRPIEKLHRNMAKALGISYHNWRCRIGTIRGLPWYKNEWERYKAIPRGLGMKLSDFKKIHAQVSVDTIKELEPGYEVEAGTRYYLFN
jgi:hypothetical protein